MNALNTPTKILFYIFIGCIWIFEYSTSSAQTVSLCEPCGDINARQFGPVKTTWFSFGHKGCRIGVTYQTRLCGGFRDIKIQEFSFVGDCMDDYFIDTYTTIIIGELLLTNGMAFPAGNWRVMKPQCWKFNLNSVCPDSSAPLGGHSDITNTSYPANLDSLRIVPCDTTQCCVNVVHTWNDDCNEMQFWDVTDPNVLGQFSTLNDPGIYNQYMNTDCPCEECLHNCDSEIIKKYLLYKPKHRNW